MNSDPATKPNNPKILVVDDHELILEGTLKVLNQCYPEAKILTVQSAQAVLETITSFLPDLVMMDLSIPEKQGMTAQTDIGIELLQTLMKQSPTLNIMVQSSYVKALVRLKHDHDIDTHQGGFTIADKSISEPEMSRRLNWALQGITHTKDLKAELTIKAEWLTVLELAAEGLQDRAIAKQMNAHERTIRNYWTKLQDALEIYPQEDKNLRMLTLKKARENGLID
jgi:DNA-binding NarL/FixJ family response regulator